METWQTILVALGGNALFVAVAGWLAKTVVENLLKRDTKKFEIELEAKTTAAIEELRNDLRIKSIEYQIKFSSLHAKSAETIAEAYELLQKAVFAVAQYIKIFEMVGEPSKQERREKAIEQLQAFRSYYLPRQIFLPKSTADKIRGLDEKLTGSARHFALTIEGQETTASSEDWMKAHNVLQQELPAILDELENEFRSLLGQDPS